MKRSIHRSVTIVVLSLTASAAWGQGMPGMPGPAPYGAPVAGMTYYGDPGYAQTGPGAPSGYGPPPGMMGPGGPMPMGTNGAMPDGGPPPQLPPEASPWQNPFSAEETLCYDQSCGCCSNCCRRNRLWGDVEFLLWWQKGSRLPPLFTTSSNPAEPRLTAGVLGDPDTVILFGNELVGDEVQAGGRATLGFWTDDDHNTGIGTRFTGLAGDTEEFSATSDGSTVLARPFFNALLGQQDALLIGFTDPVDGLIATGSVRSKFSNEFISSETFLRSMLERDRKKRVDFLLGYHFFRFDNFLSINSNSTAQDPVFAGTTFSLFDRFDTENEFHGGMIGLDGSYANGRWSVDWTAKLSYGRARQTSEIAGGLTITPPALPPIPLNGGLFAQGTNIGTRTRYEDVFVPEINLALAYHVSPNMSLSLGYNYLWISSVLLSGDQIDTNVNLSQQTGPLVGPARPAFAFNDDDYWMQGINFAMNYNF